MKKSDALTKIKSVEQKLKACKSMISRLNDDLPSNVSILFIHIGHIFEGLGADIALENDLDDLQTFFDCKPTENRTDII